MKHTYGAVIIAIKNDFCLEETITELLHQGVAHALILSPLNYWIDGTIQPEEHYHEMAAIAERTGACIRRAGLSTKHTENPINDAIYTEAKYRNYAIEDLLRHFPEIEYFLTVDADEFWLPGTLAHIDDLVEAGITITLPGIPVIGIPGLPIAGAKDSILVASHRDVRFKWGRSTEGPRKAGIFPVIHFSATRRTAQELAHKCFKSAHYPDKTYDFDGWLAETLPNVHVGMKNVHMYKSPENIWPEVRAWSQAEIKALPASLLPYLKT